MRKKYRERFLDPEVSKKIEVLENAPDTKRRLERVRTSLKSKVTEPFCIGAIGVFISIVAFLFFNEYAIIPIFFIWQFCSKYIKKSRTDIADLYVRHFLKPVLTEILPDTEVDYFGRIDLKILSNLVRDSEKYYSNCHIIFGDDYRTEFCNLESYHYTTDKDDHEVRHTDFTGQVLCAKLETNISGHIRVVPVYKKGIFGKNHWPYGNKRKDENEIQTESIEFNNSYSIFSTDDFYTRLILDANIIELLNNMKKNMDVAIYMNEKYISVAFESKHFLFTAPHTKNFVDKLSLAGEYEKVRTKLADFYALIDIIGEKF